MQRIQKSIWIIIAASLFISFLLLIVRLSLADCLNSTHIETINQLANATNMSNASLIGLFNSSCNYCETINSTLYNRTNESNTTIYTLNYNMNSTLFNETGNIRAQFLENLSAVVNRTYSDEARRLYNNFTSDTNNILSNMSIKFQGMLETKTNIIWEQMSTKQDLNATKDYLLMQISTINKQNELTFGNNIFYAGLIFLAGIGLFIYYKYFKHTYPKISTRFIPKAMRITPYELDEEKELVVKSDIDTMRKFILSQTEYRGATRAEVYKKFLSGEIETQEQAIDEMKIIEPDKMDKSKPVLKKSRHSKMDE